MSDKKYIGKEMRGSGGLRTQQNQMMRGDDESQHNYQGLGTGGLAAPFAGSEGQQKFGTGRQGSQMISAHKDSKSNALVHGPLGSAGDIDSESAQNLISKAQVYEVIKGLNIREGLFSDDDVRQLEGGYSVSDTEDEMGSAMNDILSAHSYYQHKALGLRGVSALGQDMYSPQIGASPNGPAGWDENVEGVENQVRFQQFNGALMGEIQSQKSRFSKKFSAMERQMEQLRLEKQQLAQILETQRQNFKFTVQQQEQRSTQIIKELKDSQKQMVDQLPAFQEKLELYKQELAVHQLLISEEVYVELKIKQNQSLKEFVQVKVYETLQTYLRDLDKLRYDNQEATSQLLQYRTQLERERMEKETVAQQLRDIRLDTHRRIEALERRNQELESDNQVLNQQIKSSDVVHLKQSDQLERLRQLEIDKKHFEQQSKALEQQVNKIQESKHEVERRSEALRREIDMLTQDKNFLSRERGQLQDQVKRLEDKLDRAEQSLAESKRQVDKYMDRVLNTNDDLKSKFDQKYSSEIEDLKARHSKELEMHLQNMREHHERRIEDLTERKEELEMRFSKVEKQLSDRSQAYEELLFEYRKLQKSTDEEIGHLRIQARSRDDEVQRVTNLYEDNMVLVKETKLESEALKSKIDVLKTEYYKLESTARQGTADIRAELAVSKERLANYELIEKELDQAIMHVSNDSAVEDDGTNAIGNALIQTITSAPTTAKRRIQQSLLLANRLQTKQRDYEALQKELQAYKYKVEKLEDDGKLQQRLLQKMNQPNSYMIADIEKSEKELDFAQRKIKQLEEALRKAKSENDQLKLSKRGIMDDLQKLNGRKQEIDNLHNVLIGIINHSTSRKIDVDDLRVKLAEGMKREKQNQQTYSSSSGQYLGASVAEMSLKKTRKASGGRSKSPLGGYGIGHSSSEALGTLDNVQTMKMGQGETDNDDPPAWYRTLKKNLK